MSVDGVDCLVIVDADMIGLNSDHSAILLVQCVNRQGPITTARHQQQPPIGKLSRKGRRNASETAVCDQVREDVVGY